MMGLSPVQLMIVLAIVLLLFGANRVPEAARGLGRGLREFRGAVAGEPFDDAPRVDAAGTPSPAAQTSVATREEATR